MKQLLKYLVMRVDFRDVLTYEFKVILITIESCEVLECVLQYCEFVLIVVY